MRSNSVRPSANCAQGGEGHLRVIDERTQQQVIEMDMLVKEKESWMLQVSELRDSLSIARQKLAVQSKESNAASELLRIHLNHLQDELRSKRQQPVEFAREKEMLLQQNGHLQEQLEHCHVQYKEASKAIQTLSKFIDKSPRLQLLNRVKKSVTE